MTAVSTEFVVSPGQVVAAREYIKRAPEPLLIPDIVFERAAMDLDEVTRRYWEAPINESKIQAAQIMIRLSGGEENVDPEVVELAHATPEV